MEHSSSDKLVRGQNLMQIAMKRLQKEFYQVLFMNRAHFDPEFRLPYLDSVQQIDYDVEDETRAAGDSIAEVEDASSIAMTDLRLIAEKGMWTIFCPPKRSSTPSATDSRVSSSLRRSFLDSVMHRTLEVFGPPISEWDPEGSNFAKVTSLIYENRREAKGFIKCVYNLQKAMQFLEMEHSSFDKLVRGQNLMHIAMKRFQKEFYQVLSMNRAQFDLESVSRASTQSSQSDYDVDDEEDEIRAAGDCIAEVEDSSSIAMTDLRLIAECMISSGYANECLKIYKVIRKSIIDEGLHKLGVEKMSSSQVRQMDPEVLDLKIKSLLGAVDVSMKTLFNGERILCDHVFASSSDSIPELIFTEISKKKISLLMTFLY
ncbi:PREDICTED: exocyst complex component EXO70A1-like [Ipomoea nil]|uniref:exocyst complex component EXO70A1-like n=1 Tax=Ipomoea nil TaxID=35883 RepID=UPI00090142FE|nr:PREDICTED: exocyst complex component EXO70A1-like [Ipomoea nil]